MPELDYISVHGFKSIAAIEKLELRSDQHPHWGEWFGEVELYRGVYFPASNWC